MVPTFYEDEDPIVKMTPFRRGRLILQRIESIDECWFETSITISKGGRPYGAVTVVIETFDLDEAFEVAPRMLQAAEDRLLAPRVIGSPAPSGILRGKPSDFPAPSVPVPE